MSAQLQPRWLSVEDYLAFEERSEIKHEYIDGEIYAMAGASARHNQIAPARRPQEPLRPPASGIARAGQTDHPGEAGADGRLVRHLAREERP